MGVEGRLRDGLASQTVYRSDQNMAAKERTEKLPTYSGTVCGVSEQAEVVEKRISLCQQFLCEVDGLESKGVRGAHKLRKLLASEHAFLRSVSTRTLANTATTCS